MALSIEQCATKVNHKVQLKANNHLRPKAFIFHHVNYWGTLTTVCTVKHQLNIN